MHNPDKIAAAGHTGQTLQQQVEAQKEGADPQVCGFVHLGLSGCDLPAGCGSAWAVNGVEWGSSRNVPSMHCPQLLPMHCLQLPLLPCALSAQAAPQVREEVEKVEQKKRHEILGGGAPT